MNKLRETKRDYNIIHSGSTMFNGSTKAGEICENNHTFFTMINVVLKNRGTNLNSK